MKGKDQIHCWAFFHFKKKQKHTYAREHTHTLNIYMKMQKLQGKTTQKATYKTLSNQISTNAGVASALTIFNGILDCP